MALAAVVLGVAVTCAGVIIRDHLQAKMSPRKVRGPAGSLMAEITADESLEHIRADLSRLAAHIDRVHGDEHLPGRATRLRALSVAYDDTLLLACRTLELPAPERPPLSAIQRLEAEADLARCGLSW